MTGFQHDIAGGGGNLVVTSVQSPNYSAGAAGWQIRKDGSAEFNNLTIRGTFNGTDFIINSSGAFFYSGTPAAGNLLASIAPAAGTDQFGNAYLQYITSYFASGGTAFAVQVAIGIGFYTAPSQAGPYTTFASLGVQASPATLFVNFANIQLGTSAVETIPAPAPSITTLPHDPNSGSTWVSGERAFMNTNWVDAINANFAAITSLLAAVGIT